MSRPSSAFILTCLAFFGMAAETAYAQRPNGYRHRARATGPAIHHHSASAPRATVRYVDRLQVAPPVEITHEGYDELGNWHRIVADDRSSWELHHVITASGPNVTSSRFDWGGGYVSYDIEASDGQEFTGHSMDWGDGYITYEFTDQDGNEYEFDSDDLELELHRSGW
jgi:hypothetical protein